MQNLQDTITAPATPAGVSALAVVRVSGPDAITVVNKCFTKDISTADGYTIHYGHIVDGDVRVDEVLVSGRYSSLYRPGSFHRTLTVIF